MGTIYKLNFSNNNSYIGQTGQPIQERINQHIYTKGLGSPKLHFAWNVETYLGYEILEDNVPLNMIDATEVHYIEKYKPSLNTLPGGRAMRGLNHPRCKYTAEQLKAVVTLFIDTALSYKEISEHTKVEYSTVHDLLKFRHHLWIWDELGEEVVAKVKLGLEARKTGYVMWDKHNNKMEFDSIKDQEELLNLKPGTIYRLLRGSASMLGYSMQKHEEVILEDPVGTTHKVTKFVAKEIIQEYDTLSKYQLDRVLNGRKTINGWTVYPNEELMMFYQEQ